MTNGDVRAGAQVVKCDAWGMPLRRGTQRAGACAIAAAVAGLFVSCHAGDAAPPGMVRYNHPVYHNGKLVLWHGTWRGRHGHEIARTAKKAAIVAKAAPAAPTISDKPQPQSGPDKPFSILADPDDLVASRMAKDYAEVLSDKGASGRAIVGPTSPTGIAKVMRTDMADFAIVSLDTLIVGVKYAPDWPQRAPLVSRLAPETIEIVAPKYVKAVGDLQGKTVSFGDPDSATGITAKLLFSRLGVAVNPTYEPLVDGLDALSAGKRGAVVVLGAKDAHALESFDGGGRYQILAIPWAPALESFYAPARVTASDRPNLVAANEPVETVAEPMALIALDAPDGSQRAEVLGRKARIFFDNYDAFLSTERDKHWHSVNLAAEPSIPNISWRRLAAAQGWLEERKTSVDESLDAFRASAKSAADASGGPTADDSDRLYQDLVRWRSLTQ
jgi:hypothetical protein